MGYLKNIMKRLMVLSDRNEEVGGEGFVTFDEIEEEIKKKLIKMREKHIKIVKSHIAMTYPHNCRGIIKEIKEEEI